MTFLDILYPKRCPVCHEIVAEENARICRDCERKLSYIKEPFCMKCGKALSSEEEYCPDCMEADRSFQWNAALLQYDEVAGKSVAWFKYHNRREYAVYYAGKLWERYGRRYLAAEPEVIVPVPIHPSRRRKRGYNQAEILGRELAKYLCIPVNTKMLIRKKQTRAQKNLSARERMWNLSGAFAGRTAHTEYRRVLLVDDIYTTGATMECCSRILLHMGVEKVYGTTICAGFGEGL